MSYATDKELELAASLGYRASRTQRLGHGFVNGFRHVWTIESGWQTAELMSGKYCDHIKFVDLTSALNRPLTTTAVI